VTLLVQVSVLSSVAMCRSSFRVNLLAGRITASKFSCKCFLDDDFGTVAYVSHKYVSEQLENKFLF
jgi:hypothetical protein